MNIIFKINGGIGKVVAATAVCSAIKKKYPQSSLIVISGYPDVFTNNPHVQKSLLFNQTPYFYKDFIEGKEVKLFLHDPYETTEALKADTHLIKIWCEMNNIPYNGEQPELFLTQREIDYFQAHVQKDRPMLLMQTNGGMTQERRYSWARDIPVDVVLKVIEHFSNRYSIFHVRREDQISYSNTFHVQGTFRYIAAIALMSDLRLCMDSFLQHTLAALKMPAVSLWIANTPEMFGYDLHTHIKANPFTVEPDLRNSFIRKFDIAGVEQEFPYNKESEIFNADEVIAALEAQATPAVKAFENLQSQAKGKKLKPVAPRKK